jgi:teichuronic acid biosynthesis glycosyltransferase TuaC
MARPRIALVTFLWPLPGAPHAGKPIYETALRLQDHAEVEVFCPSPVYPRLRWLQPARHVYHRADSRHNPLGVQTHYLEYRTLPWLGRAFNGLLTQYVLEPALRDWRPDLILAFWLYPTAWAAVRVGRRLGVPVVVGARGSDLHRVPSPLVRRMTATALNGADAVLTVSEDLRRMAVELGANPSRTHSIPNGCDARTYRPMDRLEARRSLGLSGQATLLVQVGHLLESKGVFDLWDAFVTLSTCRPDLQLAFVGEGPAGEAIQARAASAGLAERLIMPGPRPASEIALWMNAADVVCLASHGEGCPNVVIEALSCGRPVVGSDVGGIPELVHEGCGRLAPARNSPAFAEAIQRVLETAWDSEAISSRFSRTWDDVALETYTICASCLSHPPAG